MIFKPKYKPFAYFDPDGGGSGAGGGDGNNPAGSGNNNAGGDDKNKANTVAHTQEQLNELFADRAKRGAEAAIAELLKKLKVDSVDSLATLFTEGQKLLDGQKTEAEKLQAKLDETNTAIQKLTDEKEAALAQATEKLMRAAVTSEAAALGFRPEAINDVWLVVDRPRSRRRMATSLASKKPWKRLPKQNLSGSVAVRKVPFEEHRETRARRRMPAVTITMNRTTAFLLRHLIWLLKQKLNYG